MISQRRRGFTLIELLVVIAIIAILAAMLFPVFARARESARKIQCLSNIKNIAVAYQMYLTDYDRFPPTEHRQDVIDWMHERFGDDCDPMYWTEANPYLRLPVIMDEYVKNREVWSCPSGRFYNNFAINSCLPDWFTKLKNSPDFQCSRLVWMEPYPPGWGGSVTDTTTQRQCGGGGDISASSAAGSFGTNYASPMRNKDVKTSQINDVAKWLVVGECSEVGERDNSADYAYDTCQLKCSTVCGGDWVNCSWSEACSIDSPKYQLDPTTRKTDPKSRPRHLGGMNVGFADGHASWFDSEAILFGGGIAGQYVPAGNLIENLSNCGFPPYP